MNKQTVINMRLSPNKNHRFHNVECNFNSHIHDLDTISSIRCESNSPARDSPFRLMKRCSPTKLNLHKFYPNNDDTLDSEVTFRKSPSPKRLSPIKTDNKQIKENDTSSENDDKIVLNNCKMLDLMKLGCR